MDPVDLYLQESLRNALKKPLGELVKGSIEETTPILKEKLKRSNFILVGVGDVTAELLISHGLEPDLVITDGLNKRSKYDDLTFEGYTVLRAKSPAASITIDAWNAIRKSQELIKKGEKVHIIIDGEEDLLVLPILAEFPDSTKIVYGQPNVGSVIRITSQNSRDYAISFMQRMEKI